MRCAYCDQPATLRIPSLPEQVCLTHTIAFWKELVASGAKASRAPEPAKVTPARN